MSTNQQFGQYELQQRIAGDTAGEIWKAYDVQQRRHVAIKIIRMDPQVASGFLPRFLQEATKITSLQHANIARILDIQTAQAAGDFPNEIYIVMEYIDGPLLTDYIQMTARAGQFPSAIDLTRLLTAIASAVDFAHQRGILHGDLKPANIMFRPTGEAVLIDFGLSRHEQLPDLLEEQFHRPTGTPDYMAPEQLFRVRSDKRSDIYAFGAVLYQLATGDLPFGRPIRMRKVRRRVWRDPVPPRILRPDTPPPLQEIILKCLEPVPDARYGSATDLLFDLRHLDLVELTERAARAQQSDFRTVLGRRLRAPKTIRTILASATKPPPRPPIILTVVDLRTDPEELRQALLEASASVLANTPGARLACVHVMPASLLGVEENVDAAG